MPFSGNGVIGIDEKIQEHLLQTLQVSPDQGNIARHIEINLGPGEIVGAGSFFDVSVWTVTLTAMTAVKVQILEREAFLALLPKYPGIESSLADFSRRSDKVPELLQIAGENRRKEVRYSSQLNIVNSLLDGHGKPSSQQFKGQLEDFSVIAAEIFHEAQFKVVPKSVLCGGGDIKG